MKLPKLPARYEQLTKQEMAGDSQAASILAQKEVDLTKGGKPSLVKSDEMKQDLLAKTILRPGVITWKHDEPFFNLKAASLKKLSPAGIDLSRALAARYMKAPQAEWTKEFGPKAGKKIPPSKKPVEVLEKAVVAKEIAEEAAGKAAAAGKVAAEVVKETEALAGYFGAEDEKKVIIKETIKEKSAFGKIVCMTLSVGLGVGIGYFLWGRV
jgi:hypothetical protein